MTVAPTPPASRRDVAILASGACSPLGIGADASRVAPIGERAESRIVRDPELARAGLLRPLAARVEIPVSAGVDRATALLDQALRDCVGELDRELPSWRTMRVGAAIGTSSGGMRAFEDHFVDDSARDVFPRRSSEERTLHAGSGTYIGPFVDAARPCALEPVSLVLGACASSTLAIGLGRIWLLHDRCDLVLCGGFDAVSVFVAAGFECLRATSSETGPQPFRMGRDGLALGEGAAVVALVRAGDAASVRRVRAWVTGFGASCDAAHLTAPDAQGSGLARAADAALEDAGWPTVGLISAHGTATKHNDAAEAAAVRAIGSDDALGIAALSSVPLFSFKGTIGHTLGAAGVLELLAAVHALDHGIAPASTGEGVAEAGVVILDRSASSSAETALKLSSAFGGANAALVTSRRDVPSARHAERPTRDVRVSRAVVVGPEDADVVRLTERTGYAADRIARADELVRITLAAVASLEEAQGGRGALRGAGIIVGHGLGTIETNALFLARLVSAGAARGEPRRFPFTTPNAGAGECAVVFGLTGPSFAVGGGPHGGIEALGIASELVLAGATDRVVVVAADHAAEASARLAPGTRSGAVALLVSTALPGVGPGPAGGRLEHWTVRFEPFGTMPDVLPPMDAHRALLPLADEGGAVELDAAVPWGGFARARVFWL